MRERKPIDGVLRRYARLYMPSRATLSELAGLPEIFLSAGRLKPAIAWGR